MKKLLYYAFAMMTTVTALLKIDPEFGKKKQE